MPRLPEWRAGAFGSTYTAIGDFVCIIDQDNDKWYVRYYRYRGGGTLFGDNNLMSVTDENRRASFNTMQDAQDAIRRYVERQS